MTSKSIFSPSLAATENIIDDESTRMEENLFSSGPWAMEMRRSRKVIEPTPPFIPPHAIPECRAPSGEADKWRGGATNHKE